MSNRLRTATVRSMLTRGALALLVGITLGCGATSPAAPTPAPVPVPTAPSGGAYTITAGKTTVAAGDQLTVSFTASPGGRLDWIAIFRKGDSNFAYGWWTYTGGATSGTRTLTAPGQAGQYEFRYLLEDEVTDTARSSLVTVY